jgi:hypothetical protein
MVLVKACCSTLTAFSHGEVPVWPKAGAARNRATTAVVRNRKRNIDERKRLQRDMFTGMPPPQIGNANHDSEGRLLASPGRVVGLRAMRESAVHATWPRSVSRRSWSFSPINSVVPRSRSPLPQAVRDAERRTGEPGVALLAGVRGENSPHYTKRPRKRKSSTKKMRENKAGFLTHSRLLALEQILALSLAKSVALTMLQQQSSRRPEFWRTTRQVNDRNSSGLLGSA